MAKQTIELTESVAREVCLDAELALERMRKTGSGMVSSSELWLVEAKKALAEGKIAYCTRWSLRSLEYSEGLFGATMQKYQARFGIQRAGDLQ